MKTYYATVDAGITAFSVRGESRQAAWKAAAKLCADGYDGARHWSGYRVSPEVAAKLVVMTVKEYAYTTHAARNAQQFNALTGHLRPETEDDAIPMAQAS